MANSVTGVREVQQLLDRVGKASAKVMTASAKAGAKIVQADAKANATEDTGAMKRGIKLKAEKRKTGKKVYRIGFYGKSGKGEEFVRIYANGTKRAFYPVSQEYGWVDRNGVRHPGVKFLRNALNNNREAIKNKILETMGAAINRVR